MIREIRKFGYVGQSFEKRVIGVKVREGTTDDKVIVEVLANNAYQKKKYGFLLEDNERWIDMGANIGVFSLLVLAKKGTSVVCIEPETENIRLLHENLMINSTPSRYTVIEKALSLNKEERLFLCRGDYNKYRHTLYPIRHRESVKVETVNPNEIVKEGDCVKMDIEGTEIQLLEDPLAYLEDGWIRKAKKLVFEYSFDRDPSVLRFLEIIKRLRGVFTNVHYSKVKDTDITYNYYPMCTMVFCSK